MCGRRGTIALLVMFACLLGVCIWRGVIEFRAQEENYSFGGFYVGRRELWCRITNIVRPTALPTVNPIGWIACGDGNQWATCVDVYGLTNETPLPRSVRFGYKYRDYGRCTIEGDCNASWSLALERARGFELGNPVRCWHEEEGTEVYLKKDMPSGAAIGFFFGITFSVLGIILGITYYWAYFGFKKPTVYKLNELIERLPQEPTTVLSSNSQPTTKTVVLASNPQPTTNTNPIMWAYWAYYGSNKPTVHELVQRLPQQPISETNV